MGRKDDDECECREQSITIWDDGSYEHVSVHYNHSKLPDDGDKHKITVFIYTTAGVIAHTFSDVIFVPRENDKTLPIRGQSDRLREEFDKLHHWDASINCN